MDTLRTLFDFVFMTTGLCKVYKKLAYIIRMYSVLIIEFYPHAAINLNFRQDFVETGGTCNGPRCTYYFDCVSKARGSWPKFR